MKSITELSNRVMTWVQSKEFKQEYDLVLGDGNSKDDKETEIVARLIWQKSTGTIAQAQIQEGSYIFQRTGFLRPKVNVRLLDSDINLFTFEPVWSFKGIRGELHLPDGIKYYWKQTAAFKTHLAWFDSQGQRIVLFKNNTSWKGKTTTELDITYPVIEANNLGLLVTLGEYLSLLHIRDAAAASAASSAGVVAAIS